MAQDPDKATAQSGGMILHDTHIKLLSVLEEHGGFSTADISRNAEISYCRDNPRMRSGAIRSWLSHLERAGYVAKLDDKKPVAWTRTSAGTAALKEARA